MYVYIISYIYLHSQHHQHHPPTPFPYKIWKWRTVFHLEYICNHTLIKKRRFHSQIQKCDILIHTPLFSHGFWEYWWTYFMILNIKKKATLVFNWVGWRSIYQNHDISIPPPPLFILNEDSCLSYSFHKATVIKQQRFYSQIQVMVQFYHKFRGDRDILNLLPRIMKYKSLMKEQLRERGQCITSWYIYPTPPLFLPVPPFEFLLLFSG